MRTKIMLAVTLLLAATTVSACNDGHPGHDGDRHGRHHHRGDNDHPGY